MAKKQKKNNSVELIAENFRMAGLPKLRTIYIVGDDEMHTEPTSYEDGGMTVTLTRTRLGDDTLLVKAVSVMDNGKKVTEYGMLIRRGGKTEKLMRAEVKSDIVWKE